MENKLGILKSMSKPKSLGYCFAGFRYKMIQCPENKEPIDQNKGKSSRFSVLFSKQSCAVCLMLKQCRVKEGKKGFYLHYTAKEVRLAKRRIREKEEGFRKLYAMRAGIEATNSEAKRTTGLGDLRVRGMRAVTFSIIMKLVGLNIRRTTAFKIWKNKVNKGVSPKNRSFLVFFQYWMRSVVVICLRISMIWRIGEVKSNFSWQ